MAGSSKSVVRYCGPRSMFRCKLTNNAPLAKNCTPEIVPSPARTRRGSAPRTDVGSRRRTPPRRTRRCARRWGSRPRWEARWSARCGRFVRRRWRPGAIPSIRPSTLEAARRSGELCMINVAAVAQQLENDCTKAVGKSLLMSAAIGGIGVILIWNILSNWPSLNLYMLPAAFGGLVTVRLVFRGQGRACIHRPGPGRISS